MVSYCTNILWVFGDKNDIETFLNYPYCDFEHIIPMPKELDITHPQKSEKDKEKAEKNSEKYGYRDWYEWRMDNWGTKWNVADMHIKPKVLLSKNEKNKTLAKIHFLTASFPSIPVTEELSYKFPTILFTHFWDEPEANSAGLTQFLNGDILYEKSFPSVLGILPYCYNESEYAIEQIFEDMKNPAVTAHNGV